MENQSLTIVDLVLFAAKLCHRCRFGDRPTYEYDQENGASCVHYHQPLRASTEPCNADQIWQLVHYLESKPNG